MTVFFDLDGTLLDDDAATRAGALAILQRHRVTFDLPDDVFVHRWKDLTTKHWRRYEKGEVTFAEQRRARVIDLFGVAGRPLSMADADDLFQVYVRHYEQNWRSFPDVLPCLDALDGRSLGVISNGDPIQQCEKLERISLLHRFTTVTISGAVGVSKPDPAIFQEACRRMRRTSRECAYVGDRRSTDDCASARAGLRGIWIDRSGVSIAGAGGGIDTIHTLSELPYILGYHAGAHP